jgi:hypothetical protein
MKQDISLLVNNKEEILDIWLDYTIVQEMLCINGFKVDFFREKFASKVFDFAIAVVKSENTLGDCPVIGVMLMLFKKKHIPLADVYMICVHLKNALLHFSYKHAILNDKMIEEISTLMDYNFNGVIKEYTFLYYNDEYKSRHCSLTDKKQESLQEIKIQPQTLQTTSALSYLQDIDLDTEMIAELDELESDTLNAIEEAETITQNSLYESANLFEQYAKVLNMMLEFGELEYTLGILKELLLTTEYNTLNEDDKNMITIYLKAIISDLQSWRMAVFITHEAEDIHYLDKTLMSSIAQLQITLMPQDETQEDEIEFF